MDLYFFTDSRFAKSRESIYNLNGSLCDTLWERYLEYFDRIIVVARIKQNAPINDIAPQTKNPRVSFVELPYYVGPIQYLKQRMTVQKIVRGSIKKGNAYICRLPSKVGHIAISQLRKEGIPYAIEVVGDPQVSLSYKATHKIIPAILGLFAGSTLRKCAINASAALYVTNEILQKKYPVCNRGFSVGVSDVVIDTKMKFQEVRPFPQTGTINVLSIGSLEQMYKAPDIVLKAIAVLIIKKNVDLHMIWLGDGRFKQSMKQMAASLGIAKHVSFIGNVTKAEVNEYLHKSDVYVQASRTEGLPRALIEAMAVGLPCVGTKVGGIPELLGREYLMNVDDYNQLANIILRFKEDADYVKRAKETNFTKAMLFNPRSLKAKRDLFFQAVKKLYL